MVLTMVAASAATIAASVSEVSLRIAAAMLRSAVSNALFVFFLSETAIRNSASDSITLVKRAALPRFAAKSAKNAASFTLLLFAAEGPDLTSKPPAKQLKRIQCEARLSETSVGLKPATLHAMRGSNLQAQRRRLKSEPHC